MNSVSLRHPRSFDPMKDAHPAKFVVESLANEGIYEPLKEWILHQLPAFLLPGGTTLNVLQHTCASMFSFVCNDAGVSNC